MTTTDSTSGGGASSRRDESLARAVHEPRLLPLLPMIHVAWADGTLIGAEIRAIRAKAQALDWLNEESRAALAVWLDPESPPSPQALQRLLGVIRSAAGPLPERERRSLSELGLEMLQASLGDSVVVWGSQASHRALSQIEEALGLGGPEVVRELLGSPPGTAQVAAAESGAAFDVAGMRRLLDGEYAETRQAVRTLLCEPRFRYAYALDRAAYRARVLDWCRELARRGLGRLSYPEAYGGADDMGRFIAAFETLAFFDLSLVIKFGVQFGLFGGSILHLGTARHHTRYLREVGSLALPGCFAMTERGHGSNVRDLETTARFDPRTGEFVIHTPSDSACKDYIGNAAVDGRLATVFAQLEIDGEAYGVHAFLVPIRRADGTPQPGVRIEDCDEKVGLNGVDNGRLWFHEVRIPRENLLNRFAEVTPEGAYQSPIPSASARFFTMLGTLVGGRVSVAAAALSAAKSGLAIAVRYGARRRQFGPAGKPETPLLDYPTHQRRLMPRLATAYALDFATKDLVRRYVAGGDAAQREVEVLAAGLKTYTSWFTAETLQVCRECCGGQGYLAVNRLGALRADTDVFTTFEGDNTVLLQLVAKGLLTNFRQHFQELKFFGVMKFLASQAGSALSAHNPVVTRRTDEAHLRDPDFQRSVFRARERDLLTSVARRLKKRIETGMESYDAFIDCQDHLVGLARAHVERVVLEQFAAVVARCADPGLAKTLKLLCDLFALGQMERDRGWFLEEGYLEGSKAKAIRRVVTKLCREARAQALPLVDAFAIPEGCLGAPIAT